MSGTPSPVDVATRVLDLPDRTTRRAFADAYRSRAVPVDRGGYVDRDYGPANAWLTSPETLAVLARAEAAAAART